MACPLHPSSRIALALLLVACHADVGHAVDETTGSELPASSSDDESTGGDSAGREPPPPGCTAPMVGGAPLRRLNAVQYRNTVDDLFGGVVAASDVFPASVLGELYTNDLDANPASQLGVEQMMQAAELVALAVVEHPGELMGCAELGDACARDYLEQLAPQALRRPLREQERTALLGLYAGQDDPAAGVAAVVSALLQSPSFLYLVDEGVARDDLPDDVHALDDHELATRLSYLLWDRPPDAELRAAADAGELADAAAIAAHTRRMLDDHERTSPAIARFYAEWLGLAPLRPADKEPALEPAVAAAIDRELVDFVAGVVLGDAPQLAALWTSSRTHVDPLLAQWLGAPAGSEGWLALDGSTRAGLLARPAVAAVHSDAEATSPTRRGHLVRTRVLCESIPPMPPDAAAMAPELPADASTRERAESRMHTAACAGCHLQMDAIGLAFEHYDARGAWREHDDGRAIDARGEIVGGAGVLAGGFDGLAELQAKLADSEQVHDCLVQQWIRHVLGLDPTEVDPCVLADLQQRFAAAGGDLHELVVLTTTSDAFRLRRLEAP